MNTQLATQESAAIAQQQPTPMQLIAQASLNPEFPMERMQQLFDLQMRWEANEARKAYNDAMNRFKASLPTITKNKHVRFETSKGITEYWHATHDNVVKTLVPALNAVGIRHRWKMNQDGGLMTVTCVLTHELGHSEEATLSAAYDQSGGKNSIQAVVSAKTYLERHTFLAVTGLTTEEDDDGRADAAAYPADQVGAAIDAIHACRTESDLKQVYQHHAKLAQESGDKEAVAKIADAKNTQWHRIKRGEA
jgi:hypothetical protein